MWNTSRNTVFMVTHDVDEAILLSDRILLMTNGPEARIAEMVHVSIPRPRSRETIIEHAHYYKIRNHIIHFLVRHAKHETGERSASEASTNGAPAVVNFEEDSVATH
jgi:nitrate/nitrite transport system ATP-binding protein